MMGHYAMIGVATLFAALAALFVAISFATDHWLETRVDRDDIMLIVQQGGPNANSLNQSLAKLPAYFSRNRGLFRTCYEGENVFFLDDEMYKEDLVDTNCLLERGYEIDGEDQRYDDPDYDTRIHLMRVHVAFYIVSLILLVAAIACGALGCWKYSTYSCRAAAMCCIAAVLMTAGGVAFFHGYEYLEKEKINIQGFPKADLQNQALDDNCKMSYGYSYILGWLGAGFCLIAGVLYICVAWSIRVAKREKEQPFDAPQPKYNLGYQTYQPESQQTQPVMMMPPPSQVVTPAPSVMGGYRPTAMPANYVPAQSMYGGYGYQ